MVKKERSKSSKIRATRIRYGDSQRRENVALSRRFAFGRRQNSRRSPRRYFPRETIAYRPVRSLHHVSYSSPPPPPPPPPPNDRSRSTDEQNQSSSLLLYRCNGMVNHCIIYATERGYGFAEPYNIHRTLKHLVIHYAQNSLEEHNESLTTTLRYPALASQAALAPLQAPQHTQIQGQNQNEMEMMFANPRMLGWSNAERRESI